MTLSKQSDFIGKRCSLLKRRQDLSVQSFRDHWAGPHAVIARAMPGISRYTQNRILECLWTRQPSFETSSCDGIVELEFRDEPSLLEANESDAVRRLLPEDEPRFLSGITLCRVPVGARQTWQGMSKVMLVARLTDPNGSPVEKMEALLLASGCVESSVDVVADAFHRSHLAYESDPPEIFATLWFDPRSDLQKAFGEHSAWHKAAAKCLIRGAAWLCDPLAIVE